MIDTLRMIQPAAIIGDCLLAGILVVILSALIAWALRRKRPRIHDAPRPPTVPHAAALSRPVTLCRRAGFYGTADA